MTDPLRHLGTRQTPQTEAVPGKSMTPNSAGGYGFEVDDWARLQRFLVLGSEGGSYYVTEKKLTFDNVEVVHRLAATAGTKLVDTIIDVSERGRAPKVNPTLYALAVACASSDLETRRAAYAAIPRVCRTGTHLFLFAGYVQRQRGWSRGLRNAIGDWYTDPPVEKVAYQAVKYRQREGWTHRDLLRLSHPSDTNGARAALFDFICGREVSVDGCDSLRIIEGYQRIATETNPTVAAELITTYGLPWETVPDALLTEAKVWDAILDAGIGITALIRNLARLTRIGVIAPLNARSTWVTHKITDGDLLRHGRVHPLQVLDALLTYEQGHGARGQDTWTPVASVVDALDQAFYLAFETVQPANKRTLLAIDVSASMSWRPCAGSVVLMPSQAAAAMALVTAATEPAHHVTAFSHRMVEVKVSPRQRLDDVLHTLDAVTMGGTDCALPMLYATYHNIEVDTFCVYTDNETWAGQVHPFQALRAYREKTGIPARLVVCGMTSTGFTIADPSDAGMLDVVGFDSAAPAVISDFSAGRV